MSESILFCTPCYGGMVTAQHFRSCMNLKEDLTNLGIAHDWNIGTNESLVHRARMEMTRVFLATDHSHLFWLDADIEFKTDDVAKLWNLQADVAVAAYSMKRPDQPLSAWRDGKLVTFDDCPKEPFEVDYAGTGFMVIRRDVIETLTKTLGTYQGQYGPSPAVYQSPITNGFLESEDYFFCRQAREAGFKVIMDPSIKLGHWGQYRYGA